MFDLVTGILLFRVLTGFGSTWDGPDLELIMGDPNTDQVGNSGLLVDQGRHEEVLLVVP